ncbi:response regulator [Kallotenue papyrolyticum]|uniref:response regulator n=1 Tax=Kallotenue papyrolyticum TaxID=1325125 RepID=UPI00049235F2|nr:response regulator transcription factor [Kallotenue papyrolyticum]
MEPARILIVDDEAPIVELICAYLRQDGFAVATASDGLGALEAVERFNPDLVVLDVLLPGLDGLEICRRLHQTRNIGILMVSARAEEVDRLMGLGAGADDYLTKPFSPRELVARVKAILRRLRPTPSGSDVLSFRHLALEIDVERREVRRAGRNVELTPLEFQLLRVLAASPGRVFTREQLLQRVWGDDFYGTDRVVDVHIGLLRRKLEVEPGLPQPIQTVRGVGYRFSA